MKRTLAAVVVAIGLAAPAVSDELNQSHSLSAAETLIKSKTLAEQAIPATTTLEVIKPSGSIYEIVIPSEWSNDIIELLIDDIFLSDLSKRARDPQGRILWDAGVTVKLVFDAESLTELPQVMAAFYAAYDAGDVEKAEFLIEHARELSQAKRDAEIVAKWTWDKIWKHLPVAATGLAALVGLVFLLFVLRFFWLLLMVGTKAARNYLKG